MPVSGIFFGVLTAVFQNLGYYFSRKAVLRYHAPGGILCKAYILMGLMSLPFLLRGVWNVQIWGTLDAWKALLPSLRSGKHFGRTTVMQWLSALLMALAVILYSCG